MKTMTNHKLGIIMSVVGLIVALAVMVAVNVIRVQTVYGQQQVMKGHVIDVQDNILIIELDGMDEPYPEYYTPVEIRIIDLGIPDPVVTPTAVGECEEPCD